MVQISWTDLLFWMDILVNALESNTFKNTTFLSSDSNKNNFYERHPTIMVLLVFTVHIHIVLHGTDIMD